MNVHVVSAVFRRNFIAYFTNPTGYVFICVFVLLSSLAAFWPNEFFVANLANLDQLNRWLPWILLVFIPAITMSIWADERRQGTDELLLTIPATDLDVVAGKYLASVAIYTVSLAFSLFCNWVVLALLGRPDVGLFFATYFGHWLVGLAMLSIGMTASFLTGNLTVGFVLGVVFNVPLIALAFSDTVVTSGVWGAELAQWSVAEQFRDFGRGVVSLSSLVYFLAVIVAMLYLSIVLIGRRHWAGGRDSGNQAGHFAIRTISLIVAAVGLVMITDQLGVRADISSAQLSSLSPQTRKLIRDLDPKQPVQIDAYISREVPEAYVQTRLNLLSALREFSALGSGKVVVHIFDTEPNSDQADQAEKLYGIAARRVEVKTGGAYKLDEIYLGVAFMSGLNKVVVPFIDTGIPVEYELARSITTVSRGKRKKLGVIRTDAQLFAGFDQASMSPTRNQQLIDELEKQYDVKQVSADQPIAEKFDVLLAVQPSSLSPEQMDNFVAVVKSGTPTAIFEDPFPYLAPGVTATSAPKQPPANPMAMFQQQPPMPKGDLSKLWKLIGVTMNADQIVYQRYNPHPRFELPPEFVFIDQGASDKAVFNADDPISSGLQEMLYVFPGSFMPLQVGGLTFKPLVMTGASGTGYVTYGDTLQRNFMGQPTGLNNQRKRRATNEYYTLAAHISGTPSPDNVPKLEDIKKGEVPAEKKDEKAAPLDIVVVSDIDLLFGEFFEMRARGNDPNRSETNFNFDNVTFVLNVIDSLAGDADFLEIRKRRPVHRTLTTIDKLTEKSRVEAFKNIEDLVGQRDKAVEEFKKQLNEGIEKLKNRKEVDPQQLIMEVQLLEETNRRRLEAKTARETKEYERKRADTERKLALETRHVQNIYKTCAVVLPPIPPLLIGLAVFFMRRAQEREGVSRNRLR